GLRINHGLMDAFGGLYVVSQWLTQAIAAAVGFSSERDAGSNSLILTEGECLIHHYWLPSAGTSHHAPAIQVPGRSFTQRMVGGILEAAAAFSADGFDICVALDELSSLNLEAIGG